MHALASLENQTMMLAPHIVTKVLSCIMIVHLLALVVVCSRTPINFSFRGGVVVAGMVPGPSTTRRPVGQDLSSGTVDAARGT